MSNLIALLTFEISYRSFSDDSSTSIADLRTIKKEIGMKVTLAAKDAGDDDWKIIASKNPLKRNLNCRINTPQVCIFWVIFQF